MKLLMCPPSYFNIAYEINPWMSRSRPSDAGRALRQWEALRSLLAAELPAEIEIVPGVPGLPDMVFTANAGIAWGRKFIVSNFRHEVRRGETRHFEAWFRAREFELVRLPQDRYFEGEGDCLRCGDRWFAGYRIRSDAAAHQRVAEIVESEVLSLELTSDWFYHLDTCFCPLRADAALYYPPAFDAYGRRVLETEFPELIAVTEAEARRFACNAVVSDRTVVMNTGCPRARERLAELGFRCCETPLDEFIKAGGSAKCLTLMLP